MPTHPPVRQHLDPDFQPTDWATVAPVLQELVDRPIDHVDALAAWAVEAGEVVATLDESASLARLASMQDTTDEDARAALGERMGWLARHADAQIARIDRRLLDHPLADQLPEMFTETLKRASVTERLFSPDSAEDKARISALLGEWHQISGTWPPPDPRREDPDRAVREEVWRTELGHIQRTADDVAAIVAELTERRHHVAQAVGLPCFLDYGWAMAHRPYTPAQALALCEAIRTHALPRLTAHRGRLRDRLGVDTLRPWDLDAPLDDQAAPTVTQDAARKILLQVDPSLGEGLGQLAAWGMVDLEARPNKAPGAFHVMLEDRRLPFIYLNNAGTRDDLRTMLHETGHALHALGFRDQALFANRQVQLEFAEVSSMSMELLGAQVLGPEALADQLVRSLEALCIIARNEPWRHWLCQGPRTAAELFATNGPSRVPWRGGIDYAGLEAVEHVAWTSGGHIIFDPLYNIEYAIAQVGALQIWRRYLDDPRGTVADLQRAWALGASVPVPELFRTAGIEMWPSTDTLAELLEAADPLLTAPRPRPPQAGTGSRG